MIRYISTRGGGGPRTFEEVLLGGLAPDGGLYVPEVLPRLDPAALKGKTYAETATAVMLPFVEGSIDEPDFRAIVEKTYSRNVFRHPDIAPVRTLYPDLDLHVLELFHGPTIAFKDIALQLLGRLFEHVLNRRGERVTIVGATSGDTGSAAIEGCRHCRHAEIFILFPQGRVSEVQRRQMTTAGASNVHCIAVEGTFDDCQALVKAMFADATFRDEMNLSAVNSINWARIMAQIVYYVTSALALGAPEREVTFAVPTGNFGNVLAGHYARKMGLPIKLAIASNRNDILTRFFESGEMKAQGVRPTLSPSMDIEISSNFERYLFDLTNRDPESLSALMREFGETGSFNVDAALLEKARNDFQAFRTDENETLAAMKRIYRESGYLLDPHTAVGMHGALRLAEEKRGPVVVLATASPAKFPEAVERATGARPALPPHLSDLMAREEDFIKLPSAIKAIKDFISLNSSSARA